MTSVGMRFGVWRAGVMLPAVVGGMATVLVLTGGLGAWQLPVLLGWLGVAPSLSARRVERVGVRLMLRFRPLTSRERDMLGPVTSGALGRCALRPGAVDWWVQPGHQRNACAAGRRSVAVTEGAVEEFLAGRLPGDLIEAVLVHELGHHATGATRCGLAARWLAAPGRAAFGVLAKLAGALGGGRHHGLVTSAMAVAVGAVALAQAAQQGQWTSTGVQLALGVSLLLTPPLDAALSRASEYAADRYAASVGAGPELARALTVLAGNIQAGRPRVRARLLDGHPPLALRLTRIAQSPTPFTRQPEVGPPCRSTLFRPGTGRRSGGPREGDVSSTGTVAMSSLP